MSSQPVGSGAYAPGNGRPELSRAGATDRALKQNLAPAVTTEQVLAQTEVSGVKSAKQTSSLLSSVECEGEGVTKGRYLDVRA